MKHIAGRCIECSPWIESAFWSRLTGLGFNLDRARSPSPVIEEALPGEAEIWHAGIVDVEFGKNVTVVQPVNLYGCTIRDGSFVGAVCGDTKSSEDR